MERITNMARRERRRLCKFNTDWIASEEFSSWLVPVKGEKHKAYCLLCKKVFAVSHGGLNDVKAHYKGKRHIFLQRQQEQEKYDGLLKGQSVEDRQVKGILNEESSATGDHEIFNHFIFNSVEDTLEDSEGGEPQDQPADFSPEINSRNSENKPIMNSQKMLPQQYCLRWKYHHNNLQVMFSQLLERESFCDVTLACEGKTLRAHKVVLSACSTYFDSIFSQYEERNPIVILKDVKFIDIRALVEFMYKGEINVDHSHLASLLKTAEELRIKGLAEVSWRSENRSAPHDEGSNRMSHHSHMMDNMNNSQDVEPPYKRRKGGMSDSHVDDYSPHVPSVSGAGSSVNDMYMANPDSGEEDNDASGWEESEPEPTMNDSTPRVKNPVVSNILQQPPLQSPNIMGNVQQPGSFIKEELDDSERTSANTTSEGIPPHIAEQYRDVIKLNDYLTRGRRPQFWEEPFTRKVMDAIKSKELEMKTGAELLGVSYGTLYGRYRDAYGCLKHPYRVRDFWSDSGPADILAKVQRKEITLFRAAEMLNVTVTTLANYLSTLRRAGSLSGDEGMDESRGVDDTSLSEAPKTTSTPRKSSAYENLNLPDITIVKEEPSENHNNDDDDSRPSSVATNNGDHCDNNLVGNDLGATTVNSRE